MFRKAQIFCPILILIIGFSFSGCGEFKISQKETKSPSIKYRLRAELDFDRVAEPPAGLVQDTEVRSPSEKQETVPEKAEKPPTAKPPAEPYMKDQEYLALNRYERIVLSAREPVDLQKRVGETPIRDSVRLQDKPLILGGRGFNIQGFEAEAKEKLPLNFNRHMEEPFPLMSPVKSPGKIHIHGYSIGDKMLIFHPAGPAINRLFVEEPRENEEKSAPEKMHPLEQIPETRLYFDEESALLVLRPRDRSLDVLMGNENVNKDAFRSWRRF